MTNATTTTATTDALTTVQTRTLAAVAALYAAGTNPEEVTAAAVAAHTGLAQATTDKALSRLTVLELLSRRANADKVKVYGLGAAYRNAAEAGQDAVEPVVEEVEPEQVPELPAAAEPVVEPAQPEAAPVVDAEPAAAPTVTDAEQRLVKRAQRDLLDLSGLTGDALYRALGRIEALSGEGTVVPQGLPEHVAAGLTWDMDLKNWMWYGLSVTRAQVQRGLIDGQVLGAGGKWVDRPSK